MVQISDPSFGHLAAGLPFLQKPPLSPDQGLKKYDQLTTKRPITQLYGRRYLSVGRRLYLLWEFWTWSRVTTRLPARSASSSTFFITRFLG